MLTSYLRYGSKKRIMDVMTCHKSLPYLDGKSSRLVRKNLSQLVAFGIIHEITLARAFWPHIATFVAFMRQEITYVRREVACVSLSRPSRQEHSNTAHIC